MSGFIILPLFNEETWGLRKNDETAAEDDGPEELKSDGNAIASCIRAVLSRVVDDGS